MDEQPKKKPLSEIGHLFLSSVRERQLGGMPMPQRTPPQASSSTPPVPPAQPRGDVSIDLTPEEYAQVYGNPAAEPEEVAAPARRNPPVTAIIGEHFNGKQLTRVKEYARHLAATCNGRIGLIAIDASEFRLMCFEPGEQPNGPIVEQTTECYDPRMMAEAIEEMNFDVERWLLMIPAPRVPEAQPLLKLVDHWALLTTCDHDGVVASYRMLKGVSEIHRPRLSLAVFDAIDVQQADKVYNKLAGVCQQFLDRELESEPVVRREYRVCEHLVMLCRPTRDKAQLANPPQWGIVMEFLAKAKTSESTATAVAPATPAKRDVVGEVVVPTFAAEPEQPMQEIHAAQDMVAPEFATPAAAAPSIPTPAPMAVSGNPLPEVLDLPSSEATAEQIVNAVMKQGGGAAMLECPVRVPMCADARLAVTRDRNVVLLAVAKRGLAELNSIGQAYRWLIENRSLIGMAVPQLSIDPQQAPQLRLFVEECDAGADMLQPMLAGEHVNVQSYRRVRWGGKAGLLLEAA